MDMLMSQELSGLIVGGTSPLFTATEFYDGSTWTEVADLATARAGLGGFGTSNLQVQLVEDIIPATAATEEWSAPDLVINTLTTS
jgi:hypothetical protein